MAFLYLYLNPELITEAGDEHPIPEEVMAQAEPDEQFEFCLRYARKAGFIDAAEYARSTNQAHAA